jgi:predicted dithiol-disulfide oxidoreductase (DUF899 family)
MVVPLARTGPAPYGLWAMYQWFGRAPRGRNKTSFWLRRQDEYDSQ